MPSQGFTPSGKRILHIQPFRAVNRTCLEHRFHEPVRLRQSRAVLEVAKTYVNGVDVKEGAMPLLLEITDPAGTVLRQIKR